MKGFIIKIKLRSGRSNGASPPLSESGTSYIIRVRAKNRQGQGLEALEKVDIPQKSKWLLWVRIYTAWQITMLKPFLKLVFKNLQCVALWCHDTVRILRAVVDVKGWVLFPLMNVTELRDPNLCDGMEFIPWRTMFYAYLNSLRITGRPPTWFNMYYA